MKPILLLAPSGAGPTLGRRRLDLRRVTRLDAVDDADYASVIVLNDGGAETIRRLRLALALREHHKQLPVAVLTYLEPRGGGAAAVDALAAGVTAAAAPHVALAELGPELSVEFNDEVLSLEYQAH
jgi:hypothetical protein